MAGAGLVALSAGMAAAAPAVVQSDVNLRAGPGIEYEVIGAMPGGATVNVRRCEASWCRVNFAGTVGYASRAFLGLGEATGPVYGATTGPAYGAATGPAYGATTGPAYGATTGPVYGAATGPVYGATTGPAYGVTTGPVYGAGYAYSGYAPRYTYEEDTFGYAPGTYGTTTVGVAAGEGREFRGYRRERVGFAEDRELRGRERVGLAENRELRGNRRESVGLGADREFRGERRDQGVRLSAREERGRAQAATEIRGNNTMRNPRGRAASSNARTEASGRASTEISGNNPMKNTGGTAARSNTRTEIRGSANARTRGANANATTGAGARGGSEQDHGPNFIGSGNKFKDNHP
ncbi:MAG TPA: SH3 domain-containing protein [Xanthobacteraceae bacterium]|nr:SH3 domain-containing protein [Xanthobacteraceae bacterium]